MAAHFFITGGTGLVGANLLPRLLLAFQDSTITLLVRGEDQEDAGARAREIALRMVRTEGIPDADRRVRGVLGDVALDHCGLSSVALADVVRNATHIIHGAATIRFDHPIDEARAINCGGTRRMLAIAQACADRGRLRRFVYIGTSSVSGRRAGTILEDELEMGQRFFNTYEQSKCESERIVRDHADRLPTVIFRPSIIIGDSRTGRTSSFNVIYIPLRLLQKGLLTFVPGTPETTLDLVPIDWVDDVMVRILDREDAPGRVYHVTAGPGRAARLGEVVGRAVEYFDRFTPLRSPRTVEYITEAEYGRRRGAMKGMAEALMGQLDTLLPYVGIDRLFDSANTDAALAGSDIVFPRFAEYGDRILGYCVRSNWGRVQDAG
jgi:thioester reductase-like protein